MSARHCCRGFGLFEFLVLSLATAVVIGVVIGLATRRGPDARNGDQVRLNLPTGSGAPSAATVDLSRSLGAADCPSIAGNAEVSPHTVGGSLCLPAAADVG